MLLFIYNTFIVYKYKIDLDSKQFTLITKIIVINLVYLFLLLVRCKNITVIQIPSDIFFFINIYA